VINEAAEAAGMSRSRFMRLAAVKASTSRADLSRWQEVQVMPRGEHTLEDTMSWILAAHPRVRDLVNGAGEIDAQVRNALYEALPPAQASRIERRLRGLELEQIAAEDNCSKQAVHAAIGRGMRRLSRDEHFVEVLKSFLHERHVAHMEW